MVAFAVIACLRWAMLVPVAADGIAVHGRQASVAATETVSGTVRDVTGAVVGGATITIRSNGQEKTTTSAANGRFVFHTAAPGAITITVRAEGFALLTETIAPDARREPLDLIVSPPTLSEAVTVTATRGAQRTGDIPASVTVVTRDDIRESPAVVADDLLRQVPTFSLFRRTSSLASHPTAQGVSLRGIGPSGVSRTLVLVDGVPANDPFGGWVYWSRIPLENAERIEVVDSPSSSLYGNYAMGGVISIFSRPPRPRTLDVRTQYGTRNSPMVTVAGSDLRGKFAMTGDGNWFDTGGYPIVRASERGRVDNNAAVTFGNVNLKLNYAPNDRVRAFVRGGFFREKRANGKASTIDGTEEANDTTWTSISGGTQIHTADGSDLQATVFGDVETFHSNFLAVPAATPPRSVGRMTLNQTVPTHAVGGSVQWSRPLGTHQLWSAGTDWRWVDGDSREDGLDSVTGTQVVLNRVSGGTQRSVGVFVQDLLNPISQLTMTLSARLDHWRNYDGHNLEHAYPSGIATANNVPSLPDRADTVASPRAAARYHLTDRVDVWGDVGAGFRAPTLNELYRQFRVGQTLTLANPALGPERLVGGEAGISVAASTRATLRATWFDNRVKDPVSNVTIGTAGATVTQQRQNLGRTRVRGVQMDAEYRITPFLKAGGGYVFDRATVTDNPANPALVGNDLPQVPVHRGSLHVAYANPAIVTLAATVQFVGAQYDEDQNLASRRLPSYAVADVTLSRAVGRDVDIFLGVQNLFNREYIVGTLPTTVGSPRLVSAGVRVRIDGR